MKGIASQVASYSDKLLLKGAKMEVTAIIVARQGSIRVKNKSMSLVNGETLIKRKIRQLSECRHVDRIVFGSDSDEMLSHAKDCGAEVVRRPDYFCDESQASANEMIGNMIDLVETDVVMWSHCTNPLISSETYDNAVETFRINGYQYDSLLSVVEFKEHLWSENKEPLNYDPYLGRHTPAKQLPSYYMQDGGIFIQPWSSMKENHYFFGKRPYLFVIPENEFLDINTERDLILARALVE